MHPLLIKVGLANLERELEAADSLSKTSGSHVEACLCRVGVGHTEPISERPIPSHSRDREPPKHRWGQKRDCEFNQLTTHTASCFPPTYVGSMPWSPSLVKK